jgi:uncharacterized protein
MIDAFISRLEHWSAAEPGIQAIALVGSHARGTACADSDIDIIIICTDPSHYLKSTNWLSAFGEIRNAEREDWGLVQSWRVFYLDGTEVEFGITSKEWCSEAEISSGTGRVISDGAKIVFDPNFLLANLIVAVGNSKPSQKG